MSAFSKTYNRDHNMLKLFDILPAFSFATSEASLTTCNPVQVK